jgi:hypothetical protein
MTRRIARRTSTTPRAQRAEAETFQVELESGQGPRGLAREHGVVKWRTRCNAPGTLEQSCRLRVWVPPWARLDNGLGSCWLSA